MAASMIHTVHAPAAIGPYSQAVLTGGLLLTSGQLGLDPETGILPEGVEAQAAQALENIGAIIVDEEQEHTYKSEMSPRYDARIVARSRCVGAPYRKIEDAFLGACKKLELLQEEEP